MSLSHALNNATSARNGHAKEVDTVDQTLHEGLVPLPKADVAFAGGWGSLFSPKPFDGKPSGSIAPTITATNDKLYVLWQWDSNQLFFAYMTTNEAWSDAYPVMAVDSDGSPAHTIKTPVTPGFASLNGRIHAVIPDDSRVFSHYILDDSNSNPSNWTWKKHAWNGVEHSSIAAPSINPVGSALHMAYQARDNNEIIWLYWTDSDGWSDYARLGRYTHGAPGILSLNGSTAPHVIYATNDDSRNLRELVCDGKNWYDIQSPDESSAGGLYVSSYKNVGLLTFPANQDGNADVLFLQWNRLSIAWARPTYGEPAHTTPDTPAVAGLNDKVYIVLCGTDGKKLYMMSAPVE